MTRASCSIEPQRWRSRVGLGVVARGIAAYASLALLLGCQRVPPGRLAVDEVTVIGAKAVGVSEVRDRIATTESPKFLGLFQGLVYEYTLFDRSVLERDLARVEALYRSRGYFDVRVRAGRVLAVDANRVRVEIWVEEGQPALIRSVRIDGASNLPAPVLGAVRRAVFSSMMRSGRPFEDDAFEAAQAEARRALTDRGYAFAQVKSDAAVDIVSKLADVVFDVDAGAPCVFGHVSIQGLGDLPEKPVRRALDIDEGAPYSEAVLEAAELAALDLGLFASVDVSPDLSGRSEGACVVPVKVRVEPTRLRTVRVGGGVEFDALKTDVHGVFGWEHRNFFGGMRSLMVNLKPGVVLYPLRVGNIALPQRLLPEERLRVEFREPGFLEARTNAFVRPEFNVQALLLDPNPPPDAKVIGYAEARNAVGVDRSWGRFFGAVSHNLQVAYPFAYVGARDPTLGALFISYPELVTTLDFRDDRVEPRRGFYLLHTLQVAGGPFGGQADDVKVQPDARFYVPIHRSVVLAMRASLGFLFPRSYGERLGGRERAFEASAERTRDYQLTFFRGFFSGGPTSNRGYPMRGVGPHAVVPFISPDLEAQRAGVVCGQDIDCRTPTGGLTLWEASMELRFSVAGPLSAATFCDASDVSPREANIRLKHLHLSCGGGVRYETPVGPVRLDIGYRIPHLQVLGAPSSDEREPKTFPFGIPIAVSLGIGEAY